MKQFKKILTASILALVAAPFSTGVSVFAFIATLLFGGGTASAAFTGIFDPTGLTLYDENIAEVSEALYQAKFQSEDIKSIMTIEQGIKHTKPIILLGNFNGLAGAIKDDCDTTPNPTKISPPVQKKWELVHLEDRMTECYKRLEPTFWKLFAGSGLDKENLPVGHPAYTKMVLDVMGRFLSDDYIYQKAFFCNTAIAAGGTNSLNQDQLKYFDSHNAIFTQLESIIGTRPNQRTTIGAENTNATKATQVFTAASATEQDATDYLNQVYYSAPLEVRLAPDSQFYVTQSIADQYAQERTKVTGIPLAYTRTETGQKSFEFQGHKVVVMPVWDRIIRAWFDNGVKYHNPHRILFIPKSNMVLGTGSVSDLTSIDSYYDKVSKLWYVDFAMDIDVKIIDDSLFQYAY